MRVSTHEPRPLPAAQWAGQLRLGAAKGRRCYVGVAAVKCNCPFKIAAGRDDGQRLQQQQGLRPASQRSQPRTWPPSAVNERAWREIQRWEEVKGVACQCGGPRLVKFRCAHACAGPMDALGGWCACPTAAAANVQGADTGVAAVSVGAHTCTHLASHVTCLPAGGGRRSSRPRPACSTCWATACPLTATTGWWTAAGRRSGAQAEMHIPLHCCCQIRSSAVELAASACPQLCLQQHGCSCLHTSLALSSPSGSQRVTVTPTHPAPCPSPPALRCSYVIDFYNAAPREDMPVAMHLDVRPALDSFG